jgi:hypothetical protein
MVGAGRGERGGSIVSKASPLLSSPLVWSSSSVPPNTTCLDADAEDVAVHVGRGELAGELHGCRLLHGAVGLEEEAEGAPEGGLGPQPHLGQLLWWDGCVMRVCVNVNESGCGVVCVCVSQSAVSCRGGHSVSRSVGLVAHRRPTTRTHARTRMWKGLSKMRKERPRLEPTKTAS